MVIGRKDKLALHLANDMGKQSHVEECNILI